MESFMKNSYATESTRSMLDAVHDEHFCIEVRDMNRDYRFRRLIELMAEDHTITFMAKTFGITHQALTDWMRRNGIYETEEYKAWHERAYAYLHAEKREANQEPVSKFSSLWKKEVQYLNHVDMRLGRPMKNKAAKKLQDDLKVFGRDRNDTLRTILDGVFGYEDMSLKEVKENLQEFKTLSEYLEETKKELAEIA